MKRLPHTSRFLKSRLRESPESYVIRRTPEKCTVPAHLIETKTYLRSARQCSRDNPAKRNAQDDLSSGADKKLGDSCPTWPNIDPSGSVLFHVLFSVGGVSGPSVPRVRVQLGFHGGWRLGGWAKCSKRAEARDLRLESGE